MGFAARHATIRGLDLITEVASNPDETTNLLFNIPENHAYGVTNALKENRVDLPYQAILAARKAAQALIDFIFRLHFINPPYKITPFDLGTAVMLITVVFIIWAILGFIAAMVWNIFHKQ